MRRGVLALVAVLLAVPSAADAARTRKYRGPLGEGSITLWATKARVTKLAFANVRLYCDDGDTVVASDYTKGVPLRYGAFFLQARNAAGDTTLEVSGIVRRKRAKGGFELVTLYNEQNQQDPNGSIRCSAELTWRAKRVRRR